MAKVGPVMPEPEDPAPCTLQLEVAQVVTLAWNKIQPHDRAGEPLTSCAVA